MQNVEIRVFWGSGVNRVHQQCHHSTQCVRLPIRL